MTPTASSAAASARPAGTAGTAGSPGTAAAAGSAGSAPAPLPRHRTVDTPIGRYLIAARSTAEGDAVTGVWREAQAHFPREARLGPPAGGPDALLDEAAAQLLAFLAGDRSGFDLPLAPEGTPFQQRVWAALREIPLGTTTTYGQIARDLGSPRAAQAVGAAVGSNPISILVPCHRVLASDGSLTGYAGGLETKQALLRREGALPG